MRKTYLIKFLFILLILFQISSYAQNSVSVFDDPKIKKWSKDFLEGKRIDVLKEVENDLLSDKSHIFSKQIWCFLQDESGELEVWLKNSDNPKLRQILGVVPEIYYLYGKKEYKFLLQKFPPSKVANLNDFYSYDKLMRSASAQTQRGLQLEYAKMAMNINPNIFTIVWNINTDGLINHEKSRIEIEKLINQGGKWQVSLSGEFLRVIIDNLDLNIQSKEIIPAMDKWVEKHPSDRYMLYNKAITMTKIEKYEEAAELFIKANEKFPFTKDKLIPTYLESLVRLKKKDEAKEFAKKYSMLLDSEIEAKKFEKFLVAKAFFDAGLYEESEKILTEAEQENLMEARHFSLMALVKSHTDNSNSLKYAKKAIELEPENREFYEDFIALTNIRNLAGSEDEGLKLFLEYEKKFDQKSEQTFSDFGTLLNKLNKPKKEIIEHFQKALREFPESAWMQRELGEAFENDGQTDAALQEYLKAFETGSPTDWLLGRYFGLISKNSNLEKNSAEVANLIRRFPWINKLRNVNNVSSNIPIAEQPKIKTSELVSQLGHTGAINSIDISPDKIFIATVGNDGKGRIWQAKTGFELRTLMHRNKAVNSVTFSPDGLNIATSGSDGNVLVWEVATGKILKSRFFKDDNNNAISINSVQFSPDGKYLAVGDTYGNIQILNSQNLESDKKLDFKSSVKKIKFAINSDVLLVSTQESVFLLNTKTGIEFNRYACNESADFSDDKRFIVTLCKDNSINLFDAGTGIRIGGFPASAEKITNVAFVPKTTKIIVGQRNGKIKMLDFSDGKILPIKEFSNEVSTIEVSSDGKNYAVGLNNGITHLLDLNKNENSLEFQGKSSNVTAVVYAKSQKFVVTSNQKGEIHLWNASNGSQKAFFEFHKKSITSISLSSSEEILAAASDDNFVSFWDLRDNKKIGEIKNNAEVKKIELSPDGKFLYTVDANYVLKLWNVGEKREISLRLRNERFEIRRNNIAAFSPDSKYLTAITNSDVAVIYQTSDGQIFNEQNGGFGRKVSVVAYSPDGKQIATGNNDGEISVWIIATNEEVIIGKSAGQINGLTFSNDSGKLFVTDVLNPAKIFDLKNQTIIKDLGENSIGKNYISSSPDGKFIVTADDKTLILWNAETQAEIKSFLATPETNPVIDFSADSKRLLIGGNDSTVNVIFLDKIGIESEQENLKAGDELCRFVSFEDKTWAVVDKDGRYDAANEGNVSGLHWVVGTKTLSLEQLKVRYYEPELFAKALGFNEKGIKDVGRFNEVSLNPDVETSYLGDDKTKLKIKLKNNGGGIGRVQVFVNNNEIYVDARDEILKQTLKQNPKMPEADFIVDLTKGDKFLLSKDEKGKIFENSIRVVAWNEENWVSSRGVETFYTRNESKILTPPKLYAIIGGVSDYKGDEIDLTFAGKDAVNIADALELGARKMLCGDSPKSKECDERINITLLSDYPTTRKKESPSKENFIKAFENAARNAKAEDLFIVYLSGHGITLENKNDVYAYLTNDADTSQPIAYRDEARLKTDTMTSIELTDLTKQVSALKKVMILDTCASGRASEQITKRSLSGDQIRALSSLKDSTGFFVLMGSAADAVAYEESSYGQGLLTYSLLQGIKEEDSVKESGGLIDVLSLFKHSTTKVPELAKTIGGIQSPKIINPFNSTSFTLGIFTDEETDTIILPKPKDRFMRPRLTNLDSNILDDNLFLERLIINKLVNEIFIDSRNGIESDFRFLDSDRNAEAFRIVGSYTVQGDKVLVKIRLHKDNQKVTPEASVEGNVNEIEKLAEAIIEKAKSLKQKEIKQ